VTEKGHEDTFPRPRLSARYVIRQETFAGTHGNVRGAPQAAIRACCQTAGFETANPTIWVLAQI
jgi:hypothetical protein